MSEPITVDTARRLARQTGARRIIVFFERELPGGQLGFGYVSYGQNRRLCASTKRLADDIYEYVEDEIGETMMREYEHEQRVRRSAKPPAQTSLLEG